MKNNIVVTSLFFLLGPAIANAAAINWASESYTIFSLLQVDPNPEIKTDITVFNLDNPLKITYSDTQTFANGAVSATLGIKDLSNSTAEIFELSADVEATYSDGTTGIKITPGASVVASATLKNTFVAESSSLKIAYNYSSQINFDKANRMPSAANHYQYIWLDLTNVTTGVTQHLVNFDQFYLSSVPSPTSSIFSEANSFDLIVNTGDTYLITAEIAPDLFSGGTIDTNNSNSLFRISLSNAAVTAVPEPETYTMLLLGLTLVGFAARSKAS